MILHAKRAVRRHVSNARCGFQLSAGVVRKRGRRADSRKIVRAALINWAARLEFTPGANVPRSTEVGTITRPPADSPPHDAGSPSRRVGNSCRSSSRQSEGTRHTPTRSSTDGAAVAASANEARTYGRSASNRISARIICEATAIKPAGVVACIARERQDCRSWLIAALPSSSRCTSSSNHFTCRSPTAPAGYRLRQTGAIRAGTAKVRRTMGRRFPPSP